MNKKTILRTIDYGLLIFVMTMVLLFLLSMVTRSDRPFGFAWVGAVIAIIMALCSRWFSRRMHAATRGQAFRYGVIWAVMLAASLLLIAIPNGTTNIVFGQWGTYLIFLGVAVGPLLRRPRPELPTAHP